MVFGSVMVQNVHNMQPKCFWALSICFEKEIERVKGQTTKNKVAGTICTACYKNPMLT
jgi:hypothetical protein